MTTAAKPFSIHPIVKEGISLSARHEGNAVFLKIAGNMETAGTLGVYLRRLHGEVMRHGAKQVVVDCDELYFMSAACIKYFVTWIQAVMQIDAADRYKIKFRANPNFPWQRRTFESLRRYGLAIVLVDADSTPTASAHRSGTMPQSAHGSTSTPLAHSATMPQWDGAPGTTITRRKG